MAASSVNRKLAALTSFCEFHARHGERLVLLHQPDQRRVQHLQRHEHEDQQQPDHPDEASHGVSSSRASSNAWDAARAPQGSQGRHAGKRPPTRKRALSRLKSRKIKTCEVPVLFENTLAAGLLGAYVQATSGGALYRKSTFLLDSLGKPVLAEHIDAAQALALSRHLTLHSRAAAPVPSITRASMFGGFTRSRVSVTSMRPSTPGRSGGCSGARPGRAAPAR